MHIAWARHMPDNCEFVGGGGTQPGTRPTRVGGLDGSAAAEERDKLPPGRSHERSELDKTCPEDPITGLHTAIMTKMQKVGNACMTSRVANTLPVI